MKTKYGDIPHSAYKAYNDSLINRIWILLPLREEGCSTLKENVERLNRELYGMIQMGSEYASYILTIMHLLENSITEEDFSAYRADILRCCELVKKLGGDDNV